MPAIWKSAAFHELAGMIYSGRMLGAVRRDYRCAYFWASSAAVGVWRMHRRGSTLRKIALRLNAEGIATAHGGARWHASTVSAVLRSVKAERAASKLVGVRPQSERVV
jgi:hypothetical protein